MDPDAESGGHRLGSACLAFAAGLTTLLMFATPSAVADPPAWVAGTIPPNATVEATSGSGSTFSYTIPGRRIWRELRRSSARRALEAPSRSG